jgi:hypothetical protein
MYTLNLADVAHFDLDKAHAFVEFWSRYYNDSITVFESQDKINYFAELNVGNDLTEENLRRLLRWKDPHYLTHIHKETREENPKVAKALKQLTAINLFRQGASAEEDMRKTLVSKQKRIGTPMLHTAIILNGSPKNWACLAQLRTSLN